MALPLFLQALSLGVSLLCIITALCFIYPLQLIFIHTLIESPFEASGSHQSGAYAPAPVKDDFDIPTDGADEGDGTHRAPVDSGSSHEEESSPLAILTMHTRSVLAGWSNLRSFGVLGLFRALPAQIVYTCIYESLFLLFGGLHPLMQLLSRLHSEDPSRVSFVFSPLLMAAMMVLKVFMIPMKLVVLRQVLGKPDSTTWVGHLKVLISQVGLTPMVVIIVPQILQSGVPLLLQNLNTFLHFLYLQETVVEPGWYAFFAVLEFVWQIFSYIFIVAPLNAVLYRAQCSVIAHMPKFDALVAYPISYISPLAELKQIVEEEMHISGTWYGRYWRSFKVIVTSSIILFVLLVLSVIPPLLTGAINLQK